MEIFKKKVLSVGLCCLYIVMVCESYPKEDSDQRCLLHKWHRGGNASNNATVFAEFGVPCEILGTLSTDVGGQFMKNDFKENNISFENCRFYHEYESPVSTVWISAENGSRTIVHSNKNMPEIRLEDFRALKLENYAWIHFEIRPHYEEIKSMIGFIRQWNDHHTDSKIKISVEIEKPRTELEEFIPLGDVVFISKDFAAAWNFADMKSAVESLCHKLRPDGILICAWGEQGACGKMYAGATCTSEACIPSKVVNTLGAGDTFVAATILSLMRGDSLNDALQMGCRIAGTKCGMHGLKGLAHLCPFLKC